jgi:microcystin-dependent protein
MSQPFIGEIRCFGFPFAPLNWAFCNGQTLPISQHTTLYAVIGTNFGGDGTSTFGVPNLQGAAPMHWGNGPGGFNTAIGQIQGQATVTLTTANMPAHKHAIIAQQVPSGGVVERTPAPKSGVSYLADVSPGGLYVANPALSATFSPAMISTAPGNSLPHDNMQPYLTLNFCISLLGIFPSR